MIVPMSKSVPEAIPELRALLESCIRQETTLPEMRNQLYRSLPTIFPKSAESERELLAEILTGIYEVSVTGYRSIHSELAVPLRRCEPGTTDPHPRPYRGRNRV